MRRTLLIVLLFATFLSKGQVFYDYNDTINHFSIEIPAGWKYGVNRNTPSIKLLAFHQATDSSDHIRDNFNLNIFESFESDLDRAFQKVLESLQSSNNFKLIDTGSIAIKGQDFKWLIELHENQFAKVQMTNYDFVTCKKHKTYILTFVALSDNFLNSKQQFYRIATSLEIKE